MRAGERKAGRTKAKESPEDPRKAARSAGLIYSDDGARGIRREGRGKSARYVGPSGKVVRNSRVLKRISSLAIPPAWKDVWICPQARGHLQATGRDARGRKQYLYHPHWREARDESKYDNLIEFARALPRIRRRVARHLRRRKLSKEKVLAGVVKLLEETLIRVGNDEYAKDNHSFGLTTMKDRHAKVNGKRIRFEFQGKSGIEHDVDLADPRLARTVRACQELPGQELFQYLDDDGEVRDVNSSDVNEYLREISGQDFTAKDFRTWAGTALAAQALEEFEDFDSKAAAKRNIAKAIERVAERLGNTKAICRKCYVHPAILEAYTERSLIKTLKKRTERELRESLTSLSAEEAAVLALLQQRMERQLGTAGKRNGVRISKGKAGRGSPGNGRKR
jgi:DNA topoisomerase I